MRLCKISKGETINEGIMKQYTGGDKIMGRALYAKPSYFVPQFKLVACTNNLFGVKSTDNGTWRRIKKVDYESKFVKGKPSSVPADKEFAMDEDVKEKIPKYIEIFASLLCGIAHKTKENIVNVKRLTHQVLLTNKHKIT